MEIQRDRFPDYVRLHDVLLDRRSRADSSKVVSRINRAMLAGESVRAAFYDLTQLRLLQQRKSQPLLTLDADEEIAHFLAGLARLMPASLSGDASFRALQQQVILYSGSYRWQYASLKLVQNAFFNRTYLLWQAVLHALFRLDADPEIFRRLEQLLMDSLIRISVLGDSTPLYAVLSTQLAHCRAEMQQRADSDGLSDYVAAADIAARGIALFTLTAEAVLRGRALPTARQLESSLVRHQQQVIDGTHPWFSAP